MDIFQYTYNDKINYENLIILVTSMVYLWFWITVWTNYRRRSHSFIEYYLRFFLILPFWLYFILVNAEAVDSNRFNFLQKQPVKKEFNIHNNVAHSSFYTLYGQNIKSNKWEFVYPEESYFYFDQRKLDSNSKRTISYLIDSTKYKKLALRYYPEEKQSDVKLGILLSINSVPTEIYSDSINQEIIADLDYDFTYELKKILVYLLALFAIWYHQFVVTQRRKRRAYLPIRILMSLYFLFVIFNLLSPIILKDFFGI